MARRLKSNAVRRRLFNDDDDRDQGKVDNLANVLKERTEREKDEQKKKWNFDFENEVPLDGVYEWYKCDSTADWVGVKKERTCKGDSESCLSMKLENEETPITKETTSSGITRKRKLTSDANRNIRKKINFDEIA